MNRKILSPWLIGLTLLILLPFMAACRGDATPAATEAAEVINAEDSAASVAASEARPVLVFLHSDN